MNRMAGGAVLTAAALMAMAAPAVGHADATAGTAMGCETVHWGLFGSDRRQICDGPKQPDGTWQRTRTVYTPASFLPLRCTSHYLSSSYGSDPGDATSVTCTGGYPVPQTTRAQESYVVAPTTVLPDEPGWLAPGTDNVF
ncbi:hypothetical protein FK535_26865 [Mycolicibacterium sp. 018/SC-01/001]|nr:hypothetical protein FK535_26865 [Mycolicibacterium sp. 018/SC-01/001]